MKLLDVIDAVGADRGCVGERLEARPLQEPRPWYVQSAIAITIWIGALSLGSALLGLNALRDGPAHLVAGLVALAVGAVVSRATRGLVRLHVSLVAYAASTSLLVVFLDHFAGLSDPSALLATAFVQLACFILIAARPVRFKATFGVVLALWGSRIDRPLDQLQQGFFIDALIVGVAVAFSALWIFEARVASTRFARAARPAGFALALGLLWVSAFSLVDLPEARCTLPFVTAVALASILVVVVLVAARESETSLGAGSVWLALLGIAGAAALASSSPAILTAVLIIALGRLRREPVLEGLGVVGLAGFAVWLYYGLHVSLLWTSGALVLAGAALILGRAWILRAPPTVSMSPRGVLEGSVLSPRARREDRSRHAALVLVPALVVVAVVLALVVHKQRIIDGGRSVLLELAPRDPRSFLQGDYVELRYRASDDAVAQIARAEDRGIVVFQLGRGDGGRGHEGADVPVGRFLRVDDGAALTEDELRVRYRVGPRGIAFGATSWFFEEGRGAAWERARYAELKVAADGTTVLVGLRGEDLQRLR